MTASDVVAVLNLLDSAHVDVWVDGGWGVDALVGRQTRPHSDLDLALGEETLPDAVKALATAGFRHDGDVSPGMPARYVVTAPCGRVDIHPLRFDEHGDGWQDLGAGTPGGRYPADGLRGEGVINGRRVRCLTAALQRSFHDGYEWSEADRHDMELLACLDS
jgi:lincosamide nucleotidyltransferase A/C/D/E